jgi:predicted Rossmann fold flavoprotein
MKPAGEFDVIVIGAGAAGLMCAATAGQRGRAVLVLDHARKPGNKIRMSGGGKCNFTNYAIEPGNYLSHNPHFVKSALSRYTQWDFLALIDKYRVPFHERDHGQLFCDNSAKDVLDLLLAECDAGGVEIRLKVAVEMIEPRAQGGFTLTTSAGRLACQSLVIASGGLSIPTMGATPYGYQVAEQFGIKVWPPSAGLVPFTLKPADKARFAPLTGIAVDSRVWNEQASFRENLLFTHRGLSGPAILQISNYWQPGETVHVDLLPDRDLQTELISAQQQHPNSKLKTFLAGLLPKRLVETFVPTALAQKRLQNLSHEQFAHIAALLQDWQPVPNGTEGYRTAEVTRGGVDCDAVSSKTFQARAMPGLYFIGEVLDVTGWLGGYNFQWAWASGWCAGQYV